MFKPCESRLRLFKALKDKRSLIFSILTGVVLPFFDGRNVPPRPNHPAPGVISGLPEPVEGPCELFQPSKSRLLLLYALRVRKSLIFSILTGVVLLTFGG